MTKKILFIICTILLISGCGADSLLKKSANNKLIDTKGFQGSKRRPLYNKKYIDRAKLNISQSDYEEEDDDDDEADERMSPSVRNRYMYQDMLEEEMEAKRKKKSKKRSSYRASMDVRDDYPDVAHSRDIAKASNNESDIELKKELSEIKSMLSSARKDLTKYRCPIEKAKSENKSPVKSKLHEQVRAEKYAEDHQHVDNAVGQSHKQAGPNPIGTSKVGATVSQPQPQPNVPSQVPVHEQVEPAHQQRNVEPVQIHAPPSYVDEPAAQVPPHAPVPAAVAPAVQVPPHAPVPAAVAPAVQVPPHAPVPAAVAPAAQVPPHAPVPVQHQVPIEHPYADTAEHHVPHNEPHSEPHSELPKADENGVPALPNFPGNIK